ncbi:MAG TPA: hypothetical protein VFM55_07140 [Micromonosporaceae bacterium]|nr:hypothetical protein [Micromonosporaceae bacterium]
MAAILLTAGALLLTRSPAHAQGVWTAVPSPNEPENSYLSGADASDAGHVWAVRTRFGPDAYEERTFTMVRT